MRQHPAFIVTIVDGKYTLKDGDDIVASYPDKDTFVADMKQAGLSPVLDQLAATKFLIENFELEGKYSA